MPRTHHPADYNLAANPSLPRTNSPWRIYGAIVVAAVACGVAWYFLRAPIRVSRPALTYSGNFVIATAEATNESNQAATLSLRVVLKVSPPGSRLRPPTANQVDQQDVEIIVPSRSTLPVSCEFPLPEHPGALEAEVQVIRQL